MKKLFLGVLLSALATVGIRAQILQKPVPVVKQSAIINSTPVQPAPLPPTSTYKTSAGVNQYTPVYSMSAFKVIVKTGADNKEFPSAVGVSVWRKGFPIGDYDNNCLFYLWEYKKEMASNSITEIGIDKYKGNPEKYNLSNLQNTGFEIRLSYRANFILDAWKVENLSFVIEFKDQNGNLHPTLGGKTISFSNANGFLNNEYSYFKCLTDEYFNPLTAAIQRR